MKQLIFLISIIFLASCEKEKEIIIRYKITNWESCTQINLSYTVNGETRTESNINPDTWGGYEFRYTGNGTRFTAEPTCASGTVNIGTFVNGNMYGHGLETEGTIGDPAVVELDAEFFKDWY